MPTAKLQPGVWRRMAIQGTLRIPAVTCRVVHLGRPSAKVICGAYLPCRLVCIRERVVPVIGTLPKSSPQVAFDEHLSALPRNSGECEMRMSTACCAHAPQRCTSCLNQHFLPTFQEVTPSRKTRNQLYIKAQQKPVCYASTHTWHGRSQVCRRVAHLRHAS
jgi:hypothetical protein